MKLFKGRPDNATQRLEKEMRVYDLLDELEIEYHRVDHEPAMTMEVCEEIDKTLGATICKNLFLCNRQQTVFYLLMIPDTKSFVTKDFSKALGISRVSFAPASFMEEYLDITPGSVSVLGLMNDRDHNVNLIVDREVLKGEYVGCHPCDSCMRSDRRSCWHSSGTF
jgi:Ala-tRNA(Pro) deacylase